MKDEYINALIALIDSRIELKMGQAEAPATVEPEEAPEVDELELPDPVELRKMGKNPKAKKQLVAFAEELNLNVEGKKGSQIASLLLTVIKLKEEKKLTKKEANALADAIGIEPGKNIAETTEALNEFFNPSEEDEPDLEEEEGEEEEEDEDESEEEDEDESEEEEEDESEEEDEEEDEDESEEDEEEEDESEEDEEEGDESEEDEEEGEEEAEEFDPETFDDFPKKAEMIKRLTAYNKGATKAEIDEIEFNKAKLSSIKEAYLELAALLVKEDGSLAEWGEPYVNADEEVCNCGIPLSDEEDSEGDPYGECYVTGRCFVLNDDDEIEEVVFE